MRTRTSPPVIAGLLLGALCSACYTYRPLADFRPEVGAEVRADLATPISVRVGEFTLDNVNRVEGEVYETRSDSIMVWGTWVQTPIGSRYHANGGAFFLDRRHIGTLHVRRFSLGRTGVAAVAGAGILVALFSLVDAALGGGGGGGPGPDPY